MTYNFGKAISRLRKEKGLTQKNLANKVGVSDKAVSRWETGRNYPDIETLQRLAEVLDVSVNDLLSGDVQFADKKNKRNIIIGIIIALLLYFFPIWHLIPVTVNDFFSAREVSYLAFRGSPANRISVSNIIDTAEAAFSDIQSTYDEAEKKYGMLSIYATPSDDYSDVIAERHKLRIWSIVLTLPPTAEHRGCMWVYYSQEAVDEKGEVVTGAWRVPSLWYLDKNKNGEWYVVDIKEL